MGKKKKSPLHTEFIERQRQIRLGDEHAAKAISLKEAAKWKIASIYFWRAARCYREAGLGLLARQQWLLRGECFDAIGDSKTAASSRNEAEAVPTYWEGEK